MSHGNQMENSHIEKRYATQDIHYPGTATNWRQAESSHRRGPKTVPAPTTEVMSFSLFSLDFIQVLVVMLFLWRKRNSQHFNV